MLHRQGRDVKLQACGLSHRFAPAGNPVKRQGSTNRSGNVSSVTGFVNEIGKPVDWGIVDCHAGMGSGTIGEFQFWNAVVRDRGIGGDFRQRRGLHGLRSILPPEIAPNSIFDGRFAGDVDLHRLCRSLVRKSRWSLVEPAFSGDFDSCSEHGRGWRIGTVCDLASASAGAREFEGRALFRSRFPASGRRGT